MNSTRATVLKIETLSCEQVIWDSSQKRKLLLIVCAVRNWQEGDWEREREKIDELNREPTKVESLGFLSISEPFWFYLFGR